MLGKLTAQPGQRVAVAAKLLESARIESAAGRELYLVGTSTAVADAIWVTERCTTEAAHDASLVCGNPLHDPERDATDRESPEGTRFDVVRGKGFGVA